MRRTPVNAARSYGGGTGGGLLGVIARANQWAGGDRVEAHRVRLALELRELVRMPVPHHRQMVPRGAEVLPHGQHLHSVVPEEAERLEQLLLGLAESGHQAGLRDDVAAAHLLRVAQHATGAEEAR